LTRVVLLPALSETMRTRDFRLLSVALLLPLILALAGPLAPSRAAESTLTNGCTVSARGIPSCGAYVGATYGANADVSSWESAMGKTLGVHRTFWASSNVASAVKTATADAAKNRVPWMSFKPPYSWTDMAAGKGDAWARDLATRMKAVGGPVWIAVAHEPEGEGDMQKWKAMQARLAPIMRAAAPNLGYSIILMGYHQFHGDAKYALSVTWPNTKIDIAGFDVYEKYGYKTYDAWTNFKADYFARIQKWSQSTGVPWGLAETGFNDPAAQKDITWMSRTYKDMVAYGGKAFSYFNTSLNAKTSWHLASTAKKNAFTSLNKTAPTMR
jgi:hypothetical protein